MQVHVLSIEPQPQAGVFAVTLQREQATERFHFTVKDIDIAGQALQLINGDEHFERAFVHWVGLRGQISKLVGEVFYKHPVSLPALIDDAKPKTLSASSVVDS